MDPLPVAAEAAASPLEKPIGELTEEDIAQLTREDCRRFLKDKGMRRPSWNKSQAIQQVISLKALLEGRPDSAGGGGGGISPPPAPPPTAAPPPSSYRRRDPLPPPPPTPESICQSPSSRSGPCGAVPDAQVGQMTIFYGGKVNVYDGMSAEKAQVIMQLAATPGLEPPEPAQPTRRWFGPESVATGGFPSFPTAMTGKTASQWRESVSALRAASETEPECPISRKASLQRYLEKRKDRFKGKRVIGVPSANMEMFLSPKFRVQTTAVQQCQFGTSSPTQPRPPCTPTRCSSIENKAPKLHISVDLNEDGSVD